MKIERKPEIFKEYVGCSELLTAIEGVDAFLGALIIDIDAAGPASNKVKVPLSSWAIQNGWKKNRIIDASIPSGISNSIYKVNLLKDLPNNDCAHHHRIFFHCFFDNRQAIGTNILRLEFAIDNFQREKNKVGHAIALVVDSNMRSKYGWDNAVGTSDEYEFALKNPFKNYVKNSIDFWTIRA